MGLVVLIPAFNHPADLERSLMSLADDPHPFDVLVVDDGSTPPLDCWLGVGRSLALLAVPARVRLTMTRVAGSVG